MVVLEVRFLTGRFHATPWGEHVNSGVTEWPPSPWRVLRAVVSAALRCDAPDFERLSQVTRALAQEPPTFHSPPIAIGHWRTYAKDPRPRESPSLVHDSFVSLGGEEHPLYIAWPSVGLSDLEHGWLASVVRRLRYLGRSESLCTVRLLEAEPNWVQTGTIPIFPEVVTGRGTLIRLLSPTCDTQLADLMMTTDEMRGSRRRREPPNARFIDYERPWSLMEPAVAWPAPARPSGSPSGMVAARYLLTGGLLPSKWDTAQVGMIFRSAANSRYGRIHHDAASPILSGHDEDGNRSGHGHAHYLPSAQDGDRLRLDHVLVWAPDGLTTDDVAALTQVRRLTFPHYLDIPPVTVTLLGLLTAEDLAERTGRATTWRTATPFVPSRHVHVRHKPDGTREERDTPASEVRRELARRGFPEPQRIAITVGSPAMVRYSRPNVRKATALPGVAGVQPRPYAGSALQVTVQFSEPVAGPLVLGQWSHVGLGVFEPLEEA